MDMCRTCLKTPAEKNISELNNKYPNIMLFCLDIKVPADSKITTNVCYCCYRKIIAFYKFKSKSLRNDAYLKTLDPVKLVDQKLDVPNENGVKQENFLDSEEFSENLVEYKNVEIKIEMDHIKVDETLAGVDFESDEEPLSAVQRVKYEFIKEETEVKVEPQTRRSRLQLSPEEKKKRRREQKKLSLRRARAKMTEEALDERRKKDCEKYYNKKKSGLIKPITELTPHEQSELRKIWREKAAMKRERERNKKSPKKRGRRKRAKLLKQIKQETNERQMCEECGKSVRNLKEHSLQHRPREDRKMLRCKACPKEFISPGGRNRHYKTTHLGMKSKCDICNKEVLRLPVHKLQVHNPHALRYGCVLCPRRFVAQSTLDFHMLGHTKDYTFECDVCHKKYRSKSFLSRHIRQVHDKEKSHQCHVCSKAFFKKDALHRHMRVHTHERPYSCEECGKAFSDKKTLQNHVLIHGGVRSFRCKICDAAFVRSGYLKAHMISHTKEKRHPCRYCGARFGRSDHRARHEFTAHQKHLAN